MKSVLGKVGNSYQRKEYLREATERIFYKCLSEYVNENDINLTDELKIQIDVCYENIKDRIYNLVHPIYDIDKTKRKMSRIIKLIIN